MKVKAMTTAEKLNQLDPFDACHDQGWASYESDWGHDIGYSLSRLTSIHVTEREAALADLRQHSERLNQRILLVAERRPQTRTAPTVREAIAAHEALLRREPVRVSWWKSLLRRMGRAA